MTPYNKYLLIALLYSAQVIGQLNALLYSAQVIGQLNAASYQRKLLSTVNETTTAVPLRNVSNSFTNGPSGTTSIPTVATTGKKDFTTRATVDSKTGVSAKKLTSTAASLIPDSTGSQQETGRRYFDTTTAAPPFVGPVASYRQFDTLSFIGGALLAICLAIIVTMVWKMYIAHIERRYWTL